MGGQVHDKQSRHNPALTELHRRLCSGLATLGLNKTQLAARAALGRTTVSEAFQADGPVPSAVCRLPSAVTVAALARALKSLWTNCWSCSGRRLPRRSQTCRTGRRRVCRSASGSHTI
ncbi:hypothetical protein GCM10009646_60260 [Streptomyces aureus]